MLALDVRKPLWQQNVKWVVFSPPPDFPIETIPEHPDLGKQRVPTPRVDF